CSASISPLPIHCPCWRALPNAVCASSSLALVRSVSMFDFDFLVSILPTLLAGLAVTLKATVGGYALAIGVGLIVALGRRSDHLFVRVLSRIYVAVLRCTPLLVQLYAAYYLLPRLGVSFSALTTGIVALGLYTGAYLSEVFRAGIEALPRGQWEAAEAL